MKRLDPIAWSVVLSLLLLVGCATVTFRRGAGPGDMRADEDACRATSASEAAYAACLRERGWLVAGKAAQSEKAAPAAPAVAAPPRPAAAPEPAAAPPAPAKATAPATSVGVPPPVNAPTAAAGPAAKASASATTKPSAAAPVVTAPASGTDGSPAEPAAEPEDPLTRIAVSSWWKLGGTAAELDRAMATCAAKLGDAHQPAPGGTEVTVGMRDCLREARWFPLGGSGAR